MSNARKWHVKRIFGRNRDGTDNKDVYIDVLRVDELPTVLHAGGQPITRKLSWQDDERDDENDSRTVKKLKITDPQNPPADANNPDQFIELKIIEKMIVTQSGQEIGLRFFNDSVDDSGDRVDTARDVVKKRVYFAPTTSVDDRLNSGGTVDADDYLRDEDNKDKNQYLDVEVVVRSPTVQYAGSQAITHIFNASIFEADGQFSQADTPDANDDGTAPGLPLRLDPLQNIVNVQLSQPLYLVWFSGGVQTGAGPTYAPLNGYYQSLTGQIRTGSWNAASTSDAPHAPVIQLPPGFVLSNRDTRVTSKNSTAAQRATADSLSAILSCAGGGTLFAATSDSVYVIASSGEIRKTIAITFITGVAPPGFYTGPDAGNPTGQFPNVNLADLQYGAGSVYLAVEFTGRTPSNPPSDSGAPDVSFSTIQAVAFAAIKAGNGEVTQYQVITGADDSYVYTDQERTEHMIKSAFTPFLAFGAFTAH